jgi:hypothetical protein
MNPVNHFGGRPNPSGSGAAPTGPGRCLARDNEGGRRTLLRRPAVRRLLALILLALPCVGCAAGAPSLSVDELQTEFQKDSDADDAPGRPLDFCARQSQGAGRFHAGCQDTRQARLSTVFSGSGLDNQVAVSP